MRLSKFLFQLKEQQRYREYQIQRAEYLQKLQKQQMLVVCLRRIVQEYYLCSCTCLHSFIRNVKLKQEQPKAEQLDG